MESGTSLASTPSVLPYYVFFSQLLGLTVVAMTGAWLGLYRGGTAWEGAQQFNVHPLCMVVGMVFLQGDGKSSWCQLPRSTLVCGCCWERQFAGTLSPLNLSVRQMKDSGKNREGSQMEPGKTEPKSETWWVAAALQVIPALPLASARGIPGVCVCMRAHVCMCVRACMYACVCVCEYVCAPSRAESQGPAVSKAVFRGGWKVRKKDVYACMSCCTWSWLS
jgi:hypothetical protein